MPSRGNLMIILNNKKINQNFSEILRKYQNQINFCSLQCPNCESHEYILWGTYERGVTYFKNGELTSEVIVIQRIRCKSCHKSHALLPFGIIPYKQLTDEVMIMLLSKDNDITYYSEDIITTYKKQFKKTCYPYLVTILKEVKTSQILKLLKTEKNKILTKFINETNKCFMQIKLGCLGICPL